MTFFIFPAYFPDNLPVPKQQIIIGKYHKAAIPVLHSIIVGNIISRRKSKIFFIMENIHLLIGLIHLLKTRQRIIDRSIIHHNDLHTVTVFQCQDRVNTRLGFLKTIIV